MDRVMSNPSILEFMEGDYPVLYSRSPEVMSMLGKRFRGTLYTTFFSERQHTYENQDNGVLSYNIDGDPTAKQEVIETAVKLGCIAIAKHFSKTYAETNKYTQWKREMVWTHTGLRWLPEPILGGIGHNLIWALTEGS